MTSETTYAPLERPPRVPQGKHVGFGVPMSPTDCKVKAHHSASLVDEPGFYYADAL